MNPPRPLARCIFGAGMIAFGIMALIAGPPAFQWGSAVAGLPGRTAIGYVAALIMLAGGAGLLLERTALASSRVLLVWFAIWQLLRLPAVIAAPQQEVVYQALGEVAVMLAGTWTLYAQLAGPNDASFLRIAAGERGIRSARYLFGAALVAFGLSHMFYVKQTASLVPSFLPFHEPLAWATGAAHLAAAAGVLFGVVPKLAATLEATMLTLFSILVWIPLLVQQPSSRDSWVEMILSFAISAGAWVVAMAIGEGRKKHDVQSRPRSRT